LRARDLEPRYGYAERRARAAEALKLFAPPSSLPLAPREFDAVAQRNDASAQTHDASASNSEAGAADGFFSSLRYLGQLDRTYLVCEAPGELVLIDQHAAHERVAFQRLRDAHTKRKVRTQRMLIPAEVELDERLQAVAREHASLLGELGFELEPTGAGVSVRAVPEMMAEADPSEVVAEALSELEAQDSSSVVADRLDHLLATMACHSVVRAGDVLSVEHVHSLFSSMDGIDYRAHCPHGRPVLLRLSIGELERRFGRT
jgi:DNA mismatch repair protein MutL